VASRITSLPIRSISEVHATPWAKKTHACEKFSTGKISVAQRVLRHVRRNAADRGSKVANARGFTPQKREKDRFCAGLCIIKKFLQSSELMKRKAHHDADPHRCCGRVATCVRRRECVTLSKVAVFFIGL
jgi:hypothetical protein